VPAGFDGANLPVRKAATNVHERAVYAQDTGTLDRLMRNAGIR